MKRTLRGGCLLLLLLDLLGKGRSRRWSTCRSGRLRDSGTGAGIGRRGLLCLRARNRRNGLDRKREICLQKKNGNNCLQGHANTRNMTFHSALKENLLAKFVHWAPVTTGESTAKSRVTQPSCSSRMRVP